MILNHYITNTVALGDYLFDKPQTKLIDRALGGIALQNTSEGLNYQIWEIYYESGSVRIKGLSNNLTYSLLSLDGITELSLAFDLNMNVSFSYVANGEAFLRFYDSLTQTYQSLPLENCRSPRMTYDDTREMQTNTSDVICAYINKETLQLCYRLSRDRFTIEYPLKSVAENARLIRVGMTDKLRLQFKINLI